MPKFINHRNVKPARSNAQKRTAAIGRCAALALRDENAPPVLTDPKKHRGPVRVSALQGLAPLPSPSSTLTSAVNTRTIKALNDSAHYFKTTLKKTRSTVLGLKEENRQLQVSYEATQLSSTSTAEQLSQSQTRLKAAKAELAEVKEAASQSIFSNDAYLAWVNKDCARVSACHTKEAFRLTTRNKTLVSKLQALRKTNRHLLSMYRHNERNRKRERNRKCYLNMKSKGTYTLESRAIMRTLVSAGCAQKAVGSVIQSVGGLMGVNICNSVSKRTVRRAIIEGGVASTIQIGHAIAISKCMYSFMKDKLAQTHFSCY